MQTIPDASEKDVTSLNQTHALKKRIGRMPCASSFSCLFPSNSVISKKI